MDDNYNPLVSIAMTCYNCKRWVKQAIKSIKVQDYTNWELIITDDGSTDGSLKVISEYLDRYKIRDKTKIIKHDKNYCYGKSLKTAIESGTGELVAIVDSDDMLAETNALTIMVNAHEANPDASLCYSNFYRCNSTLQKKRVNKRSGPLPKNKTWIDVNFKVKISHLKMFKRDSYNKTLGVNPTLLRAVDKDLVLKLEEVGKLVYVDEVLYIYRKHDGSLTKGFGDRPKKWQKKVRTDKAQMIQDAKKRRGLL